MRTMKLIGLSLVRNLKNPRFFLLVMIGILVLLSERLGDFTNKLLLGKSIDQSFSFAFMLNTELSFTVFPFVFAPICTLAGSLNFCEDIAHNFYRCVCTRISQNEYLAGRVISSAITGGIAGAGMIFLSAVLLRTVYPAHSIAMQTADMGSIADDAVLVMSGWGYVLKITTAFFCGGMALSVMGLASSSIVPNRYVAIFAPLLLFISLHFIMSYLRVGITPLDLLMTYDTRVPLLFSVLIFSILCFLCGIVFNQFGKRKLMGE